MWRILKHFSRPYRELCRPSVSLPAAFPGIAGFLAASTPIRASMAGAAAGIVLLACGSCALNQYLERNGDARMPRTKNRPLPSGRVGPLHALWFSLALVLSGATMLFFISPVAGGLGIGAAVWYNGVYTPLKRVTPFAAVAGGITGALPPAIGWAAAGAPLAHSPVLFICFFMFLWQVPHFWLFLIRHGEEYEYAGFPSLTALFSGTQLARIISIWIGATAVSCAFIAWSRILQNQILNLALLGASAFAVGGGMLLLKTKIDKNSAFPLRFFRIINAYMFLVVMLIASDRFF